MKKNFEKPLVKEIKMSETEYRAFEGTVQDGEFQGRDGKYIPTYSDGKSK